MQSLTVGGHGGAETSGPEQEWRVQCYQKPTPAVVDPPPLARPSLSKSPQPLQRALSSGNQGFKCRNQRGATFHIQTLRMNHSVSLHTLPSPEDIYRLIGWDLGRVTQAECYLETLHSCWFSSPRCRGFLLSSCIILCPCPLSKECRQRISNDSSLNYIKANARDSKQLRRAQKSPEFIQEMSSTFPRHISFLVKMLLFLLVNPQTHTEVAYLFCHHLTPYEISKDSRNTLYRQFSELEVVLSESTINLPWESS